MISLRHALQKFFSVILDKMRVDHLFDGGKFNVAWHFMRRMVRDRQQNEQHGLLFVVALFENLSCRFEHPGVTQAPSTDLYLRIPLLDSVGSNNFIETLQREIHINLTPGFVASPGK